MLRKVTISMYVGCKKRHVFGVMPRSSHSILDTIILILLVFLLRASTFTPAVIVDHDESMYMLVAREILSGNLPYVAIFQEKPLGMPLLVAVAMALGDQSVVAVRVLGSLCVIATSLILRRIARNAGFGRLASLTAGALYAVMSIRLGGLATNIEIAIAPLASAAVCLVFISASESDYRRQKRAILWLGILIGLAIWLKYLPALLGSVLFGWLVVPWLWHGLLRSRQAVGLACIYAFTCAAPTLVSLLFYYWRGESAAFAHANFGFMRSYAAVIDPNGPIEQLIPRHIIYLGPLLVLGLIGLTQWGHAPRLAALATAWLLTEVAAVAAPGKYYNHYFLLLMPPLCLLSAVCLDAAWRGNVRHWSVGARVFILAFCFDLFIGFISFLIPTQPWKYLLLPALVLLPAVLLLAIGRLARTGFPTSDALRWRIARGGAIAAILAGIAASGMPGIARPDRPRAVADLIRTRIAAGASLWVVNSEPIIYLLADAPIPTRFAFPPFLTSPYTVVTKIDTDAEIRRILASRPTFLIVEPERWNWTAPATVQIVQDAIASRYRMIASFAADKGPVNVYLLNNEQWPR